MSQRPPYTTLVTLLMLAGLLGGLAGCGGGDRPEDVVAEPSFHRQPLALTEPDDEDADGSSASALREPTLFGVPNSMRTLDTRGLTDETVQGWVGRKTVQSAQIEAAAPTSLVYTPAQVRAAYRLPTLPASTTGLDAATAASLGAGQTIYIVAAYHHPNAIADLDTFSRKFGLPRCTTFTLPAGMPVLPAATAGCSVAVVRAAASATVGTQPPAYNAAWAQEIALDMQWAHASAPLARIVVIEAADAASATLSNAVNLANRFGPGVVSMSFGAPEGSWVAGATGAFQGAGMSYLAATGDNGNGVSWPAVVPRVLAVGGTRLVWGAGTRSETAWAKTGGGISAWVAMPNYQTALTIAGQPTGVKAGKYRAVADLSFNADPSTGQYVAFTPMGAAQAGWYVFGGTSLSTPQWAGLVAVANAQRVLVGQPTLGAFHPTLYGRLAPGSGSYANAFFDVVSGSNGTCAACSTRGGYDSPTGMGTPKADVLLPLLAVN